MSRASLKSAGQKGVPMVVIITAGFKEMGEDGKALEDRVLAIAKGHGTRIIGPNCLGIIVPPRGIDTTYVHQSPKPGNIAFISQSGAIINTVVDWSLAKDIGFSNVISVGNQADLDFLDYLRYVGKGPEDQGDHPLHRADHRRQGIHGSCLGSGKDKTGHCDQVRFIRRGEHAASSHTGSLSGSYDVYMEAFRKSGVIAVHTLTGAFLAAQMLAHPKGYPKGKRAVVITNAGGFAVLSSDYAERYGVEIIDLPTDVIEELNEFLPEFWNKGNPIDLLGDATDKRFEKTFEVLAKHEDLWDMAFIIAFPNLVLTSENMAKKILEVLRHRPRTGSSRPCLAGTR